MTTLKPRGLPLQLLLLAGDALIVAAWLRWIAASPGAGSSPPSGEAVLIVILAAFSSHRVLAAMGVGTGALRAMTPILAVLATLLLAWTSLYWAVPLGVFIPTFVRDLFWEFGRATSATVTAAAGLLLWWRGTAVASFPQTRARVERRVLQWVFAFAVLAAFVAAGRPVTLGAYLAGLAVCGLGALAISRVEELGAAGRARTDPGPGWFVMVPLSILTVLVGVAGITALVSAEAGADLVAALDPLPAVLGRLMVLIVLFLVDAILFIVEPIRGLLGDPEMQPQLRDTPRIPLEPFDAAATAAATPAWQRWLIRLGFVTLVGILAWAWLRRAVGRYTSEPSDGATVQRRVELSAALAWADLGRAADALRRSAVTAIAGAIRRGSSDDVRSLYRRFLHAAAKRGIRRETGETPAEFGPRAAQGFPYAGLAADRAKAGSRGMTGDFSSESGPGGLRVDGGVEAAAGYMDHPVAVLTAAYNRARYRPGSATAVTPALRAAWRRLSPDDRSA